MLSTNEEQGAVDWLICVSIIAAAVVGLFLL